MAKEKHPPGLMVLFFTEMWERFGFYLNLGIFSLYLLDSRTGGFGFSKETTASIYGTFIALLYLTPFFGGIIADRYLGYRKCIVIGAVLMAAGYFVMAVPTTGALYAAICLVSIGNGFFKPNISTLVGRLYPQGSTLKDAGYNIFYMGINIGAFICNFVAAVLRNRFGWPYAFAAAGVGMLVGTVVFLMGQKALTQAADRGDGSSVEPGIMSKLVYQVILPAIAFGLLGFFVLGKFWGTPETMAFLASTIPVVAYFVLLWAKAPEGEKNPLGALLSIFAIVVVFWMIFHQNGSSLTYWAEENTRRDAGSLSPVVRALYLDQDATIGSDIKDPDASDSYWKNVPPAERPAPGVKVSLISTEIFQSINPFFVVFLTPVVVIFWGVLRRRNKEPSTPAKIAWGMLVTAASTLLMITAVIQTHSGQIKASPWWLVGTYGVITIGELCLSPMGLALVSKLAPSRLTGVMMGGWFLATAIGNKMAGVLAGFWEKIPLVGIFLINFGAALVAALLIAMLTPWIRKVMREHSDAAGR